MLDFIVYSEFSGQIVMWVPNPQTEHAGALSCKTARTNRTHLGSGLRCCGRREYFTDLPSPHRAWWNKSSKAGIFPSTVVTRPHVTTRCHVAVVLEGGWGTGVVPACQHLSYSYIMMMICRCVEGLLYHHHGTNSMSPPKELCFRHV